LSEVHVNTVLLFESNEALKDAVGDGYVGVINEGAPTSSISNIENLNVASTAKYSVSVYVESKFKPDNDTGKRSLKYILNFLLKLESNIKSDPSLYCFS
jgi:hypothetical protein